MSEVSFDHPAPTLYGVEQPDGRIKLEEGFAAPGEWLAAPKSHFIALEDAR